MSPVHDTSGATLEALLEALATKVADRLARDRSSINGKLATVSRLLTLKEAAKYLSLSLSTIKTMLISGELKVVSLGGRRMIDIRDLDVWIEQHKQ